MLNTQASLPQPGVASCRCGAVDQRDDPLPDHPAVPAREARLVAPRPGHLRDARATPSRSTTGCAPAASSRRRRWSRPRSPRTRGRSRCTPPRTAPSCPARWSARPATRRPATWRSTRPTTGVEATLATVRGGLRPRLVRRAGRAGASSPCTTSSDYDNAFWDGTQLVFGDGDGKVFDRFTKPVDVLGHEFTHAVTQYTANLDLPGPVRRAQRVASPTCSGPASSSALLGQTADRGRLADRRGHLHAVRCRAWRCAR